MVGIARRVDSWLRAYITELLHFDMPDELMKLFTGIMDNDLGFITVGILAPVAEEMVFRSPPAPSRRGSGPPPALALHRRHGTALRRGARQHGARTGARFLMGLPLGWAYIRTRSIVPGIIMHWTKQHHRRIHLPHHAASADMTLTEYFSGDMKRVALMLLCSLAVARGIALQLNLRLHRPQHD